MKFTINRQAFTAELNNVSRAISSKTTIPILTGLKIVASDAGLLLTGSNADISIESLIRADDPDVGLSIDEPGSIVLTARFFGEIVKKLPEKELTVTVKDGFQTEITSGAASFNINGQDANNYPH